MKKARVSDLLEVVLLDVANERGIYRIERAREKLRVELARELREETSTPVTNTQSRLAPNIERDCCGNTLRSIRSRFDVAGAASVQSS